MKNRKGFALVITLLVVTILVAVVVEFIHEAYVDTSLSRNFANAQQASLLAESGVNAGIKILQTPSVAGVPLSSVIDLGKPLTYETEQGQLVVSIEDQSSKINLNAVASTDKVREMAFRLFEKLEVPTSLVDSVADWTDSDDRLQGGGSEASFYASLTPQYLVRNAPLQSVEELGLVYGFAGKPLETLRPFIAVSPVFEKMININRAPKEVLASLPNMTEDLAQRIIDNQPFGNVHDVARVPGMDGPIFQGLQGWITVKGNVYRIISEGKVGETTRVIEAVVSISSPPKFLYWREY